MLSVENASKILSADRKLEKNYGGMKEAELGSGTLMNDPAIIFSFKSLSANGKLEKNYESRNEAKIGTRNEAKAGIRNEAEAGIRHEAGIRNEAETYGRNEAEVGSRTPLNDPAIIFAFKSQSSSPDSGVEVSPTDKTEKVFCLFLKIYTEKNFIL